VLSRASRLHGLRAALIAPLVISLALTGCGVSKLHYVVATRRCLGSHGWETTRPRTDLAPDLVVASSPLSFFAFGHGAMFGMTFLPRVAWARIDERWTKGISKGFVDRKENVVITWHSTPTRDQKSSAYGCLR
jgi:hypothetical protein